MQDVHASSLGPQASPAEAPAQTVALAGGTLTCETSLRSNLTEDPELGRLVATERRPPPGAGPYSPLRRRWFARAGRGQGGAGAQATLAGLDLALAPEWVRDPRLPAAFRAELAAQFSGIVADWEAQARLVGLTGTGAVLALTLPRHLATGRHPNAAFLAGRPGRALTVERVAALNAAPALAYATRRAGLPGAPVCLTFAGLDAPADPATILFLHDDLVGRITMPAEAPPWKDHLP